MKNTKLKKVSTADRLPETAGYYFTVNRATGKQTGYFNGRSFAESFIDFEYWLEERPDYEEDMKEVLNKVVGFTSLGEKVPDHLTHEIEELLTKLKTES